MSQHSSRKKHRHHHHHNRHKHASNWDWREFIARYFFGLCVAALIPVLGLCAFIGWGAYQAHLYQSVYAPELEAELGFSTDSPWITAGDRKVEAFILDPVPGGYMDKIGFRHGDFITSHSSTEFYKLLHTQRGGTVSVDVVAGGDGLPIEQRKVRTIKFLVPPKR